MSSLRSRGGIFISYRREETAANAGRLYDHLSDRFGEDRVFMDVDSIAIGVDFTRAVIEAVSGCSILIALMGRNWAVITDSKGKRRLDNPDDFVRVEIETALNRDIRVVPVLVDGAALPQAADLPPSLQPLTRRQALELSHTGFRSEVTRLVAAVNEVFEAEPGRSAAAQKTSSRAAASRPGRWQLELVARSFNKVTLRLSSGGEAHLITFSYGVALAETIKVDGKTAVTRYIVNDGEYPLSALSSAVGSDVTISVKRRLAYGLKSIGLKVGDQILTYEA